MLATLSILYIHMHVHVHVIMPKLIVKELNYAKTEFFMHTTWSQHYAHEYTLIEPPSEQGFNYSLSQTTALPEPSCDPVGVEFSPW